MPSPVSPHILVPLLPLGTAPSTLVLGLAPGPRKCYLRFFDTQVDPRAGGEPPQTHPTSNLRRVGIREAAEEKTQTFWAGIEPWTSWSPCQ